MRGELFEVLVLTGLLVLIVIVLVAVFLVRRANGRQEGPNPASVAGSTVSHSRPAVNQQTVAPGPDSPSSAISADGALSAQGAASGSRLEVDAYHHAMQQKADALIGAAETARSQADEEARLRRAELREQRTDLERREQRLADREERLDSEARTLADRAKQLDELKSELKLQRRTLAELDLAHQQALERIAGLTAEDAKSELVAVVEHDAKRQAVLLARDIERQAAREANVRAQTIIVGAIQRLASEQTSESVISAVHLPGDDMKGRIIGREGRNIRSFEQVTGVNVMIDDTPESVLLSCFDPVRRETARMTLTELVKDGRIHPARIEEVHERSKNQIQEQCLRAAEDAMAEVGISDLNPA
ncbi:MAG: DUF3552 domain-containing protein, partial [Propionibacteriaceae bacterium]|nr:DUF3552 domain-containing protein [Propionibacteriaceae bacterium]